MMGLPDISLIKRMRKQIGVNQIQLAKEAGVSQSLIARIESGKVDPAYSKVRNIFTAIEKIGKGKILTAENIMNKKIFFVRPSSSVKEAATIMKKRNISQLPVIEHDVVVGSITEKKIIESITGDKQITDLSFVPVKDIMDDALPVVEKESPLSVILVLLEYNTGIIVANKGKILGIISKADLLKLM